MWVKVEDVAQQTRLGSRCNYYRAWDMRKHAEADFANPFTRHIFRKQNKELYRNDCYEGVTNICTSLQTASLSPSPPCTPTFLLHFFAP